MNTKSIYNLIVLDESGSMESIKPYIIKGFNEVVQNIKIAEKQYPEQEHFISFVTFNGWGIKTKLDKKPATQIEAIDDNTYNPDGGTPLWDALGISLLKLKIDVATTDKPHVLVTILTDGEENASKDFDGNQINRIISELKELGWNFTYIGANHDVNRVAAALSIDKTMAFKPNQADMHTMFMLHIQEQHGEYERIHHEDKGTETKDLNMFE
jgi:Mg-chelatase subunit ChlD